jgi:membrane protease YdiL (CAAX protease family)
MSTYPWNIYLILTGIGFFGVLAMIPYLQGLTTSPAFKDRGISAPPLILAVLQQAITMAVTGALGLLIAPRIGLGLPLFEAAAEGQLVLPILLDILPLALLVGLIGGALILLADQYFFLPRLPKSFSETNSAINMARRLLIPFAGGIVEEIILRLFAFSLIAWLLGLIWSTPDGLPATGAFWAAAVISALLFAVLHLPATAAITPLTPLVVVRAILLNGILGVAFGYLFWQHGLEAAMAAHFAADVVVHIIGGLFVMKRIEDQSMTFVQNE